MSEKLWITKGNLLCCIKCCLCSSLLHKRIRNIGDQVAYIKEISFDILDYYNMINPQMTHYQLVESSHTYDVVLGKEKQQVFNVSQSIGANEVDRFQVKLASSSRNAYGYDLLLNIIDYI